MTLDEYAAWAAGIGATRYAGMPEPQVVLELGLGFASEIGEVAGVLTRELRDGEWRPDRLADELGDVAYYWARLCLVAGLVPSVLLGRSRAHVEWRQAGRRAGGPAPAAPLTLDEYTRWAAGPSGPAGAERADALSLGAVGLALAGDAGEVVECLRALAREGDRARERLAGELGDVWRYWTRLCVASGVAPAELLARSRAKIETRLRAE
jgi:NTP pyrophosphatase (non-canonical NTP hydrolase)